ncbi:MAG: molecular chaperone TorD family protein [Gammaproteobacteria bacterium]|jgi:TorA maturation chaperone TorD
MLNSTQELQEQIEGTETAKAAELPEEQARRAGIYSILAALLRNSPGRELLDHLATLGAGAETGHDNELLLSLSMLALAASRCDPKSVGDEYHDLFIGIGRGELVPYGSWYQTGFLMEKPLGQLRDDLGRLGFERQEESHEPEDHVAALFEVMAILIQEGQSIEVQKRFHEAHMASWINRFFEDLETAKHSVFYCSVARFGLAFQQLEFRYLSMLA